MRLLITILNLTLSTMIVFGQPRTIKGRLISIEDKTPMPGWNVMEPGTTNGTVTDVNGEFTLTVNSHPTIILFPQCFNALYVEYEENVDFKEVILGTDNIKGQMYKDSKKIARRLLKARPTRDLWGEVIDRKTKKPVYNCEIRVKGTDSIIYTDAVGGFRITVPNNRPIEIEIKKGTSFKTATYDIDEDFKKIKLRSQ